MQIWRWLGVLALVVPTSGCGLAITGAAAVAISLIGGGSGTTNRPPSADIETPADDNDIVAIRFRLVDRESDPANIEVVFFPPGSPNVRTATEAVTLGSSGLFGLATSPTGVEHTFLWNTVAPTELAPGGLILGPNPGVRIVINCWDGRSGRPGTADESSPFDVNNAYIATIVEPPPAIEVTEPLDMAFRTEGAGEAVFLADGYANTVYRQPPGATSAAPFAGSGGLGFNGDDISATAATLNHPRDLEFAPDGTLYIVDEYNGRIRRVATTGFIDTVVGGNDPVTGDALPRGIAVDGNGTLFFGDGRSEWDDSASSLRAMNPGAFPVDIPIDGAGGFVTVLPGTVADLSARGASEPSLYAVQNISALSVATPERIFFLPENPASPDGSGLLYFVSWAADLAGNRVPALFVANLSSAPVLFRDLEDRIENPLAPVPDPGSMSGADVAIPRGQVAAVGDVSRDADLSRFDVALHPASGCVLFGVTTGGPAIRAFNPTLASVTLYGVSIASGQAEDVAGDRTDEWKDDGDLATTAGVPEAIGVDIDPSGNLFILQSGGGIRRVDPSGIIATHRFDMEGDVAVRHPFSVAFDDAGDLFVSEGGGATSNLGQHVLRVEPGTLGVERIAGLGYPGVDATLQGPATQSPLSNPATIAFDGDLLFVAEAGGNRIRCLNRSLLPRTVLGVSIAPGNIATVVGSVDGARGDAADGVLASAALLSFPAGVVIDRRRHVLFLGDMENHRIRAVNLGLTPAVLGIPGGSSLTIGPSEIRTVAGTGAAPTGAEPNGAALSQDLTTPVPMAIVSSGLLLFLDGSVVDDLLFPRVCALNTGSATATIAGVAVPPLEVRAIANAAGAETPLGGSNGDGGPALNATFGLIYGLAYRESDGAIFVCDGGGQRIRCIAGGAGLNLGVVSVGPGDIATVLGTGTAGYGGDPVPVADPNTGALAAVFQPRGVAIGPVPNLLVFGDSANRVVRAVNLGSRPAEVAGIPVDPFEVRVVAGDRSHRVETVSPQGVTAAADGTVFFTDFGPSSNRPAVYRVSQADRIVQPVAGLGGFLEDSEFFSTTPVNPTSVGLGAPGRVTLDGAGNVIFTDFAQIGMAVRVNRVMLVNLDPSGANYTGFGRGADPIPAGGMASIYRQSGGLTLGGDDVAATPLIGRDGTLYLAAPVSSAVVVVDPVAGTPGVNSVDLPAPEGLAVEDTDSDGTDDVLYVADRRLGRVFRCPLPLVPAGAPRVVVGEDGTPVTGTATFTNGSTTVTGAGTFFLSNPTLTGPLAYVLLDDAGDRILARVSSVTSDTQLTLAFPYQGDGGTGTMSVFGETGGWNGERAQGTPVPLLLDQPRGLALDQGVLFIADSGNQRIVALNLGATPTTVAGLPVDAGEARTIAGSLLDQPGFNGDAIPPIHALLNEPIAVAVAGGNVYVVDRQNRRIRRFAR